MKMEQNLSPFIQFFDFSHQSLVVASYGSHTHFVTFTPKHFIFGGADVNVKFRIPLVCYWYIGKQLAFVYCQPCILSCNLAVITYYFQEFFCQFFQIFYINNNVICEQRQFQFFIPDMYIFYLLFLNLLHQLALSLPCWKAVTTGDSLLLFLILSGYL